MLRLPALLHPARTTHARTRPRTHPARTHPLTTHAPTQADAARVSSLVTGAGMTAALFLLLGVGFSLQLYRRRRQQILRQVP